MVKILVDLTGCDKEGIEHGGGSGGADSVALLTWDRDLGTDKSEAMAKTERGELSA